MDDPVCRAQKTEELAQVDAAMVALNDEQRLVLEWKYVDGLSVRDIARRTGCALGTVRREPAGQAGHRAQGASNGNVR